MKRSEEIQEELKDVLQKNRSSLIGGLPLLYFLLVINFIALETAALTTTLLTGLLISYYYKERNILKSLGWGTALTVAAGVAVWFSGSNSSAFVTTLVWNMSVVITAVISNLFKRPMVAWSSRLTRGWPWKWYWHSQVRPAYQEVTWAWALFFAGRGLILAILIQNNNTAALAIVELVTGWPGILVLLILSYLYGSWRLKHLGGPSVQEFELGTERPWQSQQRGF